MHSQSEHKSRAPPKCSKAAKLTQYVYFFALSYTNTVFENHSKSRIQYCERSELSLHFEWAKVIKNDKNGQFWRVFENLKLVGKQCYQTSNFK